MTFLEKDKKRFNFNGIFLPDISDDKNLLCTLRYIFEDVLIRPVYYNDNYSKDFVLSIDKVMAEGPYGYTDLPFDVRVKPGNIVIDAGAWIGDFSAYVSSIGAICYAFEPTENLYNWLCKTKDLNKNKGGNYSSKICFRKHDTRYENKYRRISIEKTNTETNAELQYEVIKTITLDSFVESNNIQNIDFIKADIEGYERNLFLNSARIFAINGDVTRGEQIFFTCAWAREYNCEILIDKNKCKIFVDLRIIFFTFVSVFLKLSLLNFKTEVL
jgi:FkbM family methyltransferase